MKIKTLIQAPALTESGYGVHARQLIFALLNNPDIDLFVDATAWGGCAFVSRKTPEIDQVKALNQRYLQLQAQKQDNNFGLFICVTIPQEFQRKGAINIGVTAAAETDRCSPQWIEKCNEMDLIVVPSLHASQNLGSILNWTDKNTNQSGKLKLEKPCVICPEGFDARYFSKHEPQSRVKDIRFTADFNFLVVGQWGNGTYGEDRKNVSNTIKYFIDAFYGRKDVGLVLKVNGARNSEPDREMIVQRIKGIKANYDETKVPPIHLIHDTLTDEEMGDLYNHPQVKTLLTLTQGEGFGLPILEAAACALPIIATNWSAHTEFLSIPGTSDKYFSAVDYTLKPIPAASVWEPILVKDSQWAVPDEQDAIRRMRKIVDSYAIPEKWAATLQHHVQTHYTLQATQKKFLDVVNKVFEAAKGQHITSPEGWADVIEDTDAFNVLYTMPQSAGDVFVSTAVIDGLMKQIRQENPEGTAHLYFATLPQYQDILKDNPNIHKVLNWQESMMNISDLEDVFDLVLTPHVNVSYVFSNWVRKGQGRLLAEEFANHCQTELGDYFIAEDDSIFTDVVLSSNGEADIRHMNYLTFHPSSGKDQHSARRYIDWQEVLANIKGYFPELRIVQVGGKDDMTFKEVDVDMRGLTTPQQLASLLKNADMHLGIDSAPMHIAAGLHTPVVALFGSSYARSTGPTYKDPANEKFILLETPNRMGCAKACYKWKCFQNESQPCINSIPPEEVVKAVVDILMSVHKKNVKKAS